MASQLSRGEKVIAFIERYCIVPEGVLLGKPLRLEAFQKQFILDVYDNPHGTRTAYLSIARKNGKTGLIAGILLAHLVGTEAVQNSQIVSGAMSRDQAAIVFNLAVKMINLNPRLQQLIHIIPSSKRLIGKPCNVEYKALSADGKTTHGLSPVLAILDEVGQVKGPQNDFIDAITTSQGAHRRPLLVAISTQAPTDADLLSIWLDDAANSKDPKIVSHVHTAPMDLEITDPDAWKAANPALDIFLSLEEVEGQAKRAARMPSEENRFRNLVLNQRVSLVSPFISRNTWLACAGEWEPIVGKCYAGLDLSAAKDLTALVIIGKSASGKWNVHPFFWTPDKTLLDRAKTDRVPYDVWKKQGFLRTTPGATVDYEYIVKELIEITEKFDIEVLNFDRWRIDIFKKEAQRVGLSLKMEPFGQGYKDMSPAMDKTEQLLLEEQVNHANHPVLTMCAANAVVEQDAAGNRKLAKDKSTGRMDGMVALVMAAGALNRAKGTSGLEAFLKNPIMVGL
ncbi:terminase large subunit [Xenorhabdus hominickii]|uniref:Terminase n=1 Tax=Xenorhabdus hominickii TaxID=351679 RepID=A0A2G0PZ25_XENHO|nr:terminase TerL endonuclease subunit [Xenorhabdus hominickii]AOM42621.1 terminase [Xenorhabdus hominickii]PHM52223.1 terminase [Xenorhabdus hominickii]